MKNLILYHEDNDGYCSAAIVNRYLNIFKVPKEDVFFYPINYHKIDKFFSWIEDKVDRVDKLIIVDFSFGENWKRLLNMISMLKIIWIDHHKNAIENNYGTNITRAMGLRSSDFAACALTWNYFFPYSNYPWVVKLVEDYDIWKFKYEDDTRAFLYGSMAEGDKISNPQSGMWECLLNEPTDTYGYGYLTKSIIRDGHCILKYVKETQKEQCKEKAYISWYGESDVKCIVINAGRGSAIFDCVKEDYDMMVVFWFDGEQYNYSFYSKEDGMDVSIIAREHGGNGHKNAAGCRSPKMLFPKFSEVKW